jgi:DNA-binding transcriptional ArsR family regulator
MKAITTIDDPRYVKALSHPLRVRLMAVLQGRKASPRQLADALGVKIGVVAYHVRTLERLGMIELVDETRVRGAIEHHYRAKVRPAVSDAAWAEAPPIAKQAALGASLQMINEYSTTSAAAGGFDSAEAHLSRSSMRLDRDGWVELSRACMRLLEDADKIAQAASERLEANPHDDDALDASLVIMFFEAAMLAGETVDGGSTRGRRRRRRASSEATSGARG